MSRGCVSSFGYSGTIAHAVLRFDLAAVATCTKARPTLLLAFRRQHFAWRSSLGTASISQSRHMYNTCWASLPNVTSTTSSMLVITSHLADTLRAPASQLMLASSQQSWQAVMILLTRSQSLPPTVRGIHVAVTLAQQLAHHLTSPRVLLLTRGVHALTSSGSTNIAHGGAWGFARVLRLEHSQLSSQIVDIARGADTSVLKRTAVSATEPEIAWRAGSCFAARLRRCHNTDVPRQQLQNGHYAITGGLGGLGLRAARLLVEHAAVHVLLASRSGRVARGGQGLAEQLHVLGTRAKALACDSAELRDSAALFASCYPLSGVLHASGVLHDGMIPGLTSYHICASFAPKAVAAAHLHHATAQTPLESMPFFSSISSTFGNIGQANYAAANAYLDTLALGRRLRGSAGSSLQIPAVREAGMAAAASVRELDALDAITLAEFALYLSVVIAPGHTAIGSTQVPLAAESLPAAPVLVELQHCTITRAPVRATTVSLAGTPFTQSLIMATALQRRTLAEAAVLRSVSELVGSSAVLSAETPLMEAGVDSLAATELSARLRSLAGVPLSPTLMFEQPTARAVAAHLTTLVVGEEPVLVVTSMSEKPGTLLTSLVPYPSSSALRESRVSSDTDQKDSLVHARNSGGRIAPGLRCLVLHGEAADGSLMETTLKAAGWLGAVDLEFVFIDAPHSIEPQPHLYESLSKAGYYAKSSYFSWQLGDAALEERSLAHVKRALAELECDVIGGVCDGSIMAALVASRHQSQLQLYINFCAGPTSKLSSLELAGSIDIKLPSLHLLSQRDELFSLPELMHIPGSCANDSAEIVFHPYGHSIPLLYGNTALLASVGQIIPLMHTKRNSTAAAILSAQQQLRGSTPADSGTNFLSIAPSPGTAAGDEQHRAQSPVGMEAEAWARDKGFDSMALLHTVGGSHGAQLNVTFNMYGIAMLMVVHSHWGLDVLKAAKLRTEPMSLPGHGDIHNQYSVLLEQALNLLQGFAPVAFPAFAVLAGVVDQKRGLSAAQLGRELCTNAAVLFFMHYSCVPDRIEAIYHATHAYHPRWCGGCHLVGRLTAPAWWFLTISIFRLLFYVATTVGPGCAQKILPKLALLAHFASFGVLLPYPFRRDPLHRYLLYHYIFSRASHQVYPPAFPYEQVFCFAGSTPDRPCLWRNTYLSDNRPLAWQCGGCTPPCLCFCPAGFLLSFRSLTPSSSTGRGCWLGSGFPPVRSPSLASCGSFGCASRSWPPTSRSSSKSTAMRHNRMRAQIRLSLQGGSIKRALAQYLRAAVGCGHCEQRLQTASLVPSTS